MSPYQPISAPTNPPNNEHYIHVIRPLSRPISFLAYLNLTSTICTFASRVSIPASKAKCTCLSLCLKGDDNKGARSSDCLPTFSSLGVKRWLEYSGDQGRHGASGLTRRCSVLGPPRNPCADGLQIRYICRLPSRAGTGLLWLREHVCNYIHPPPFDAISLSA